MKLNPSHCPECGHVAVGIEQTLPGCSLIEQNEDGTFIYEGFTEIDWNGCKTNRDPNGLVTLECDNGHQWQAQMTETKDEG